MVTKDNYNHWTQQQQQPKIFGVFLLTYLRFWEVVFFTFYYQDIAIIVDKGLLKNSVKNTKSSLECSNETTVEHHR